MEGHGFKSYLGIGFFPSFPCIYYHNKNCLFICFNNTIKKVQVFLISLMADKVTPFLWFLICCSVKQIRVFKFSRMRSSQLKLVFIWLAFLRLNSWVSRDPIYSSMNYLRVFSNNIRKNPICAVLPFRDQKSAYTIRKQLKELSIWLVIEPVIKSSKIGSSINRQERKLKIHQCIIYYFQCDL